MDIVFKIIWNWKLTLGSCKFSFRSFPTSPAIQRLHLRYPLFRNHVICQSNQEIVNVTSRSSAQLVIINVTTSTHCSIDMEFHHIPESFCVMSIHHARTVQTWLPQAISTDAHIEQIFLQYQKSISYRNISDCRKILSLNVQSYFCFSVVSLYALSSERQSIRDNRSDLIFRSCTRVRRRTTWVIWIYDNSFGHWIIELKLMTLQKKTIENFSRFNVWHSLWESYHWMSTEGFS